MATCRRLLVECPATAGCSATTTRFLFHRAAKRGMTFITVLDDAVGLTRQEMVNSKAEETIGWSRGYLDNAMDMLAGGNPAGAGRELVLAEACLDMAGYILGDVAIVWSDGQTAYIASATPGDSRDPTLVGVLTELALIHVRVVRDVRRTSPPFGVEMLDIVDDCVWDLQELVAGRSAFKRMA